MSFLPIYEYSYQVINFKYDNFMDYFHTSKGKKLLLENNIKDVNDFDKYYLYEKFIKNFNFYVKENKKIDCDKMKNQIRVFCEELISAVYHPKRFSYYLNKYNYNICDENYEYYLIYDENQENKVNKENSINMNNDINIHMNNNIHIHMNNNIHIHKKLRTS